MIRDDLPTWFGNLVDWRVLSDGTHKLVDGVLVQSDLINSSSIWSKSQFLQRSQVKFSTTWCEQQLAEDLLDCALAELSRDSTTVFADLGSGDGRLTQSLLNRGAERIVMLNFELEPLLAMRMTIPPEQLSRIQMVCGDICSPLLLEGTIDFAIAWGLWTSAHNFIQARDKTINYLSDSGLLLSAEPILDQYLAFALVMQDAAEFLRILKSGTRPISWDEREIRYPLKSVSEIRNLMKTAHSDIIWERGIGAFPSLVFGGLCNSMPVDEGLKNEIWSELRNAQDLLSWNRQHVFLSKKRNARV